ncbi:MAG: T9SS type A sorting domain-containing protein [bacterium]|nr:T9SS type A sorting domain-containing protein [bacterium]
MLTNVYSLKFDNKLKTISGILVIFRLVFFFPATINAQKIAGGASFSFAICNDSNVKAWGYNFYGQLGDSTRVDKTTPAKVNNLKGIIAISGGNKHSLALKNDNTVWFWGDNNNISPKIINNLTQIKAISCGADHSLVLKNDGTVWTWGANNLGQLGDSSKIDKSIPVKVYGLDSIIAISGGNKYSLALKNDGTVFAWGDNSSGSLGDSTINNKIIPTKVNLLVNIKAISAGYGKHSLALKNDGTVWAWGNNFYGQLGDSTKDKAGCLCKTSPVQVHNLSNIIAIEAVNENSVALKNDKSVWVWGVNINGQLGDGTNIDKIEPFPNGLSSVTDIASGGNHALALKSDGTVWAWGFNYDGELGDGTTNRTGCNCKSTPVMVSGLCSVSSEVETNYKDLAVSIYPNPSNGTFTISNNGVLNEMRYEIYNSIGEMVLNQSYSNKIDLSNSPKGVYLVRIFDGRIVYNRQIVVQ